MKKLRKSFVMLVLSCLGLFPLFSDSYYITEEQLNELQTTITTQKDLLTIQQEELRQLNQELITAHSSMNQLKSELNEQKIYYKQLEKNNKLKIIKGIGITIGVSIPIGVLAGILIGVNIK